MLEAIRLARETMRAGRGGPFGAVIVRDGRIVARGANRVLANHDPTAHAEIVAIRAAGIALQACHLADCELYTTCEPCPMCLAAAYWARLRRVWYALTRADATALGFDDERFYGELSLPPAARALPLTPLHREAALPLVEEWNGLAGRVRY